MKINKVVAVIKKLRYILSLKSLITIYKAFLRPLIDYGDIIYDQTQNESFCEKLESVQYKTALAITGAIQGSSCEKLYQKLGLESLKSRRWYRRICCSYKIMKKKHLIIYLMWFQKVINSLGLGQRVYQHSIVELTVTKILFFLLHWVTGSS